jgi:spore germination cell wall hydrolase CwlJ-like protein
MQATKFDLVGLAFVMTAALSTCAAVKIEFTVGSANPETPTITNVISDLKSELPIIDQNEWKCLTLNIFHEARSEKFLGQVLVAQVTKARVLNDKYPDTYCEVVYQNKQFSWVHQGKSEPILENRREREAWLLAEHIAYAMIVSELDESVSDIMYYHSTEVSPKWARKMERKFQYGKHIFYAMN